MHYLRKNILRITDIAKAQLDTIRIKILKLAVRVKVMKSKTPAFCGKIRNIKKYVLILLESNLQ